MTFPYVRTTSNLLPETLFDLNDPSILSGQNNLYTQKTKLKSIHSPLHSESNTCLRFNNLNL